MFDNDSLGFWDYIGIGLYNQGLHGWLVMNAWACVYFMLFMVLLYDSIVIMWIGLLPYVVL